MFYPSKPYVRRYTSALLKTLQEDLATKEM